MHFPSENRNLISLCLFFVCFVCFLFFVFLLWLSFWFGRDWSIPLPSIALEFVFNDNRNLISQFSVIALLIHNGKVSIVSWNYFGGEPWWPVTSSVFFCLCVCVSNFLFQFLIKRRAAWFPWNCGCVCVLCVQSTYLWNERPWNSAGGHRGHPWRRRWRRWVWQSVVMTVVHG